MFPGQNFAGQTNFNFLQVMQKQEQKSHTQIHLIIVYTGAITTYIHTYGENTGSAT